MTREEIIKGLGEISVCQIWEDEVIDEAIKALEWKGVNRMDDIEYKVGRFDSIFDLKNFLNEQNITPQEIIGIFIRDNGLMELLYVGR